MNAVLISISDPPSKTPRIHEGAWLDVLAISFHDVPSADPKWANQGYVAPDDADAKKIVAFIAAHQGKSIVVHCEQGISRSAAVCAVLVDLGWDYIESQKCGLKYANPLLKQLLRQQITHHNSFQPMAEAIT